MENPILIIPDVHQDIRWVRRILKTENGNFSEIIFLGDYWDSFNSPPAVATAGETADFLNEVRAQYPCTCLAGNHDLPYLEAWAYLDNELAPDCLKYACPGFQIEKAIAIRDRLDRGFWNDLQLTTFRNGHLISHAGVHPVFWPKGLGVQTALLALATAGKRALDAIRIAVFTDFQGFICAPRSTLLSHAEVVEIDHDETHHIGGPLWLDWHTQFVDDLPVPQIVGHTSDTLGPRKRGRSWCVDGYQTCYALLAPDGALEVRYPERF